jgi:hypothetical protein
MTGIRKSKYSEEQIIGFLKHVEAGMALKDLCKKQVVSDAEFLHMANEVRWHECVRRSTAQSA